MAYLGQINIWESVVPDGALYNIGYGYKPDINNTGILSAIDNINGNKEYTYSQLLTMIGTETAVSATQTGEAISDLIYDLSIAGGGGPSEPSTQSYNKSYVDVLINANSDKVKLLQSIYWDTITELGIGNDLTRLPYDKTWTHVLVYTNYQCSGYVTLKDNRSIGNITKNYKFMDGVWSFDNFSDLLIQNELVLVGQNQYLRQNVTQKFLNELTDTINSTLFSSEAYVDTDDTQGDNSIIKKYYEKDYFRDLFFVIRLVVDNEDGYQLSTGEVGVFMELTNQQAWQ